MLWKLQFGDLAIDGKFLEKGTFRLRTTWVFRKQNQSADPVSNILFASVLAVIAILLRNVFSEYDKKVGLIKHIISSDENSAIVCFLAFLVAYAWYIGKYYRVIWFPYFSLFEEKYNDSSDFIRYAFAVAIISMLGMIIYPLYWPGWIVALFVLLAYKKQRTRKLFCEAVDKYLAAQNISDVDHIIRSDEVNNFPLWVRQLISARALSTSFTFSFIIWGVVVFGGASAALLAFAYFNPMLGDGFSVSSFRVVDVIIVFGVIIFWVVKILGGGGIERLRDQLELGEWGGFPFGRILWFLARPAVSPSR
jgi:hypothetical protein